MGKMGRGLWGRGCGWIEGCLELPQSGDRSDPFFLYPMG
jgi:hypothetical protein